jgi:hypothetical protein
MHGVRSEKYSGFTDDSMAQIGMTPAVDQDEERYSSSRDLHSTSSDIQWPGDQYQGESLLNDKPSLPLHASLGKYFISGDGISRDVIEEDVQSFLGPDATVRPGMGVGSQSVSL